MKKIPNERNQRQLFEVISFDQQNIRGLWKGFLATIN